jgi:serine phosphatase RsbU (regulator of sigma subunit)/streptogramin lyase
MRAEDQLHYMNGSRIEKFNFATDAFFDFYEDKAGNLWLSSQDGVSKYDGTQLQAFDLPRKDRVYAIFQDDLGNMWFSGVEVASKFDGKDFQHYTTQDSFLIQGRVDRIFQDWRGHLWFVTLSLPWFHGGISQFDGTKFTNYTTKNGKLDPDGWDCSIDQRKHVWLSQKGVLRDLTDPDTPARKVPIINRTSRTTDLWEKVLYNLGTAGVWTRDGNYWLGTQRGLVKIGSQEAKIFAMADGLPGNKISGIAQDSLGHIWVGTHNGIGVYDGTRFHDYNREHGLEPIAILGNPIADKNGNVWFGSVTGLLKVNIAKAFEKTAPPLLYLKSIHIDTLQVSHHENLELNYSQNNLVFSYIGLSFKNEKTLRYQYLLEGYDKDWSVRTEKREVRYTNLDPGSYVFKVKAVSGAGVESEIASAAFRILPPFWKTWWFITVTSLSTFLFGYVVYRRRVNAKLEKARILNELKAAHDMQMGLMPKSDPVVPGFDISGICQPAEEVGGDYFDYVWLDAKKTKFGIAIVDVSGKAMKGAMTAVMTSGMIYSEIGDNHSPREILQKINKPMYLKTDRQIFTAMSFAVIDTQSNFLTFSSAGQTRPILKRDGEIQYLEVEGMHFPLGIQENVEYGEVTVQLQPGDLLIFYTDGVPEAMNEKQELFDFERLESVIRQVPISIRATELIEKLFSEVRRFSGAAKQHDDMTLVVVKVAT